MTDLEQITIALTPETFDELVKRGAPQASHITFAVKEKATTGGKPGVVIAFDVVIDGKVIQVQAATTLKLLLVNLDILRARFPELQEEQYLFLAKGGHE